MRETQLDKAGRPLYLLVLIVLTGMYLLVECAFNVQLLDIAGGMASHADIEHVEFYGRIISGLAVALAICGSFVFPAIHRRGGGKVNYAGAAILCSTPLVLLVFHGEKLLIDTLSERSSMQERKVAVRLSLASGQLKQGELLVQGIDLGSEVSRSPEGKTFVALFSPLVSHLPDAERLVERELDNLVRQAVTQRLGSVEDFYHGSFKRSFEPLQELFWQYSDAVARYGKALSAVPDNAAKAWNDYVAFLGDQGMTPDNVPLRYRARVRSQLRQKGIPVPNNWKLTDRKGFINVYSAKAETTLDGEMRKVLRKHALPETFPINISSFDAFLNQAAIQAAWKKALGMPEQAWLSNGMLVEKFETHAFIPLRESLIAEKRAILLSPARTFADGGALEKLGKDAVRELIVPPIALLFSLVGVIVHLCKTSFYVLRYAIPWPRRIALLNGILFAVLLMMPLRVTTPVTDTEIYAYVERRIAETNPATAVIMRWIIQAQSFMYPVNAWIRDVPLRGIRFGTSHSQTMEG